MAVHVIIKPPPLFCFSPLLKASADTSLVQCYQDLSKRLALALKHEQRRCGFLSHQAITMLSVHDEITALPEGHILIHFYIFSYLLTPLVHSVHVMVLPSCFM